MDTLLTADVAAASPRFRRKSSTFIDAIHDLPEKLEMAPAQLYSTESGRLFHAGKIAIATVGLPARGKTHISVALTRYLRWLGVKTRAFHLGDYRRATLPVGQDVPEDYFFLDASASTALLRQKILRKCREDIYQFFERENGQVAIYDAVNALSSNRRNLVNEFAKHGIQTLFIESACYDQRIIEDNVRSVKISSPDEYAGWDAADAIKHYLARINAKIPNFETMEEKELDWIRMINAGDKFEINNRNFGYLARRIVFYLMNLQIKQRRAYFVRAGLSTANTYRSDEGLSDVGTDYARKMTETLIKHREQEHKQEIQFEGQEREQRSLVVWTSTKKRTIETASFLQEAGYPVRQRSQMLALNPGVCERLSERRIREKYPDEILKHEADPYHHRYPRAESYHDVAVRMEPVILELEREGNDLLIIAHESVLRVLYGYLMACKATDIPKLSFPRDEIIEIIPESYSNRAVRIPILGLPKDTIPGSPEDIRIPVPPSGTMTPVNIGEAFSGAATPLFSRSGSPHRNTSPHGDINHRGEGSMLLVDRALRKSGHIPQIRET